MHYKDLTLRFQSTEEDCFEVIVEKSPIGDRPEAKMPYPLTREEIDSHFLHMERKVKKIAGVRVQDKADLPPELPPRDIGTRIWDSLLRDDLMKLFVRSRDTCDTMEDCGLRIRIKLDQRDREINYLSSLPWELLFDPRREAFLGINIKTLIVRDIVTDHILNPMVVEGPLRILFVNPAPTDSDPLNTEGEIAAIQQRLAKLVSAKKIKILPPIRPTNRDLRRSLRFDKPHVLHFMGHGGFSDDLGYGAIFLEDASGTSLQVEGNTFADLLQGSDNLRLVILNACQSARYGENADCRGVATTVMTRTGTPAVIAHLHSISDQAAVQFSETLYEYLAEGDSIDTALAEARLALTTGPEWATPVLFMTSEDGQLFQLQHGSIRGGALTPPAEEQEPAPVKLGIYSFSGEGTYGDAALRDACDEVLDVSQYFEGGRKIRKPELWSSDVLPELEAFLSDHLGAGRRLSIHMAAHQAIAFSTGWYLEHKSGLDVGVYQRTSRYGETPSETLWHPAQGSVPEGKLWQDLDDVPISDAGTDVAVAISMSNVRPIAEEVEEYLKRSDRPVSRLIRATIAGGAERSAVQGGAHAYRLAHALASRLIARAPRERNGKLHIFGAAPNAFLFYLGQFRHSLGPVVLYEYPFGERDSYARYTPSIELPPSAGPARSSS